MTGRAVRPTMTVQAPHWPWSQPFLVPVRPICSRSASSRVVRASIVERFRRAVDLKRHVDRQAGVRVRPERSRVAAALATSGSVAAPAAPLMNARLLKPEAGLLSLSVSHDGLRRFCRPSARLRRPVAIIEKPGPFSDRAAMGMPRLVLRAPSAPLRRHPSCSDARADRHDRSRRAE